MRSSYGSAQCITCLPAYLSATSGLLGDECMPDPRTHSRGVSASSSVRSLHGDYEESDRLNTGESLCAKVWLSFGRAGDEIPKSCTGVPVPAAGHHLPRPGLYLGGWPAYAGIPSHRPRSLGLGDRHFHAFL